MISIQQFARGIRLATVGGVRPESKRSGIGLILTAVLLIGQVACGTTEQPSSDQLAADSAGGAGGKLRVVATTTIVGDVVRSVAGDAIHLTVLVPEGTDPHVFEPTPRDIAAVVDGSVIVVSGAGLEAFMGSLLANAGAETELVDLSERVTLRRFQAGEAEEHTEAGDYDPHVWFDPSNVVVWAEHIAEILKRLDPTGATTYDERAEIYRSELAQLDRWIQEQVAQVPEANREMVTDHDTFGYFAKRYGFRVVGAVVPGYSTLSQPSAQQIAELERKIRELDVRAVFVGNTVNTSLAQRIEEDTGVRLVFLYTGSLSAPGGPAPTYVEFMRYNVAQIVDALR